MTPGSKRVIEALIIGAAFTTFVIVFLMLASEPAHSDEAPFDAYETVRDAKIGVWADDTTDDNLDDPTEGYAQPYEPVKSETIYFENGKKVCFKVEGSTNIAYYCN